MGHNKGNKDRHLDIPYYIQSALMMKMVYDVQKLFLKAQVW